jgi:hypothetical protein
LDESLRDYIWHFSRKCHDLTKIYDADIISAFWSGTNCQTLVHELSRDQSKTMKELIDITTRHASSEEAIRAIFIQNSEIAAPDGGQGAPQDNRQGSEEGHEKRQKGAKAVALASPSESWSLPATTRVTMTRMLVTPMRSLLSLLSAISSARRDKPLITLRSFSRQPIPSVLKIILKF